jgi:hypothetical protein
MLSDADLCTTISEVVKNVKRRERMKKKNLLQNVHYHLMIRFFFLLFSTGIDFFFFFLFLKRTQRVLVSLAKKTTREYIKDLKI